MFPNNNTHFIPFFITIFIVIASIAVMDLRSKTRVGLFAIVLTVIGAFEVSTAYAAPKNIVDAAITNAKTKKTPVSTVIPSLKTNDVPMIATYWDYRPIICGDRTGITTGNLFVDNTLMMTPVTAFKTIMINNTEVALVMTDLTADGNVDTVAGDVMTPEAAQPYFDAIMTCVATAK